MDVFDSSISFNERALYLFNLQATNCLVYNKYLKLLRINPLKIDDWKKIPFLPIQFFKSHKVLSSNETIDTIFSSSATSGNASSKHYVSDINIYEKSFFSCFNHFYGKASDYRILALLPSYLERGGSSLVYMCEKLISKSKNNQSGFYLNNFEDLKKILKQETKKKTLLIGVSYALLDLIEKENLPLKNTIVMETGGMKGRRKEMIKKDLHLKLKTGFQQENVHSEYGMTELLSQAYSNGNGIFTSPDWMKVIARSTDDPFTIIGNDVTGGLNIVDLANINSCAFIATQDLGKVMSNHQFEVLGRFDNSDIRGCNLMVQ